MNPRYANNETKNIARRYIDNIEAFGGTNMMPAISRALDTVDMEGRLTQVVALTDGNIANPSIMLKMIEKMPINQLRASGLTFAIIGFIIVWYLKGQE